MSDLNFLFLQGPRSPFFSRIANELSTLGCRVFGINVCIGDRLVWRGSNTSNYRGRLADWPRYLSAFLEKNKITDIVLLGEQRSYHKPAIDLAKAFNIRITVTDFGYLRPDWITLEKDGMSGHSKFPKDPASIFSLAENAPHVSLERRYEDSFWTMAYGDMQYDFSCFFLGWLYPHYRRSYRRDLSIIYYPAMGLRLLLGQHRHKCAQQRLTVLKSEQARSFVFPLQLENDFQIIAYSPFDSIKVAIDLVLKSFAKHANPELRLLFKVHPWDPGLTNWKKFIFTSADKLGIAQRIDYLEGGNLEDIYLSSEGVVTINSTAAITALQLGIPVKALGDAIYDIEGMTYQGSLDGYWVQAKKPDKSLVDAFIKAIVSTIQIRGVYYSEPGLTAAVNEAVLRLYHQKVGELL